MLDVGRRWGDVRAYVAALEALIIDALAALGVEAHARSGLVGVWVRRQEGGHERDDKIAAIGVRLRRWVSSHGFSINVAPELAHFSGIVPCGIRDDGVTSLAELGSGAGLARSTGRCARLSSAASAPPARRPRAHRGCSGERASPPA